MKIVTGCLTAIVLAGMLSIRPSAAGAPCEQLAALAMPNTTITEAAAGRGRRVHATRSGR